MINPENRFQRLINAAPIMAAVSAFGVTATVIMPKNVM